MREMELWCDKVRADYFTPLEKGERCTTNILVLNKKIQLRIRDRIQTSVSMENGPYIYGA